MVHAAPTARRSDLAARSRGTAAAAGTVGAAFSNDYEVPGTESGKANDLLREGFHGQGGDTDTIVWRAPERQSARTPASSSA